MTRAFADAHEAQLPAVNLAATAQLAAQSDDPHRWPALLATTLLVWRGHPMTTEDACRRARALVRLTREVERLGKTADRAYARGEAKRAAHDRERQAQRAEHGRKGVEKWITTGLELRVGTKLVVHSLRPRDAGRGLTHYAALSMLDRLRGVFVDPFVVDPEVARPLARFWQPKDVRICSRCSVIYRPSRRATTYCSQCGDRGRGAPLFPFGGLPARGETVRLALPVERLGPAERHRRIWSTSLTDHYAGRCEVCGDVFTAGRSDTTTCGDKCRKKKSRGLPSRSVVDPHGEVHAKATRAAADPKRGRA